MFPELKERGPGFKSFGEPVGWREEMAEERRRALGGDEAGADLERMFPELKLSRVTGRTGIY